MKKTYMKKFIQQTQNNINDIRSQLEVFRVENDIADNDDLQILYGRLYNQISKFENQLNSEITKVEKQEKFQTYTKILPIIKSKQQDSAPLKTRYNEIEKNNIMSSTQKQNIKNSNYIQSFLRTKYLSKDDHKIFAPKSKYILAIDPEKKYKTQLLHPPLKQPLTEKPEILSKELRKNPFADPAPITEKDLKRGLMALVVKGQIPKDVDLTPAFERGIPPLSRAPIQFRPFNEKFVKTDNINFVKSKSEQKDMEESKTFMTQIKQPFLQSKREKHQIQLRYDQIQAKRQLELIQQEEKKQNTINMVKNEMSQIRFENTQHKFTILIIGGKLQQNSQQFQQFFEENLFQWGSIQSILMSIEKLANEKCIKTLYIDSKKLVKLSQELIKPKINDLLSIIKNSDLLQRTIKLPHMMFKFHDGTFKAVQKIQSFIRKKQAMKNLQIMKMTNEKVIKIQEQFKIMMHYQKTKKKIYRRLQSFHERAQVMENEFKKNWDSIKNQNRIEVHLSSISREQMQRKTMEKFEQKQNSQITRIFALKDPNVEVIYVSQLELSFDLINYYTKVLELGGITNYKERLHFITPENARVFPRYFPINKLLLYSPMAIESIKKIIASRPAYIVTGISSDDDIYLMNYLNIPCYSGGPEKNQICSTKIGSKKVFQLCGIPISPSIQPTSYDNVIDCMVTLIQQNPEISSYIFKINNEFNGRGIATFSLDSIRLIQEIAQNKNISEKSKFQRIHEMLKTILPLKLKMVMPSLYKSYFEYISAFIKYKGIIEAMPTKTQTKQFTVSFFLNIEPNGNVNVNGSCDRLVGAEFINISCFFPQKSIPTINQKQICQNVGNQLYQLGVFGYISFDLLVFSDIKRPEDPPLFWGIGIDCFINNYQSILFYFDFLTMDGKIDENTGTYLLSSQQNNETNQLQQSDYNEQSQQKIKLQSSSNIKINTNISDSSNNQRCFMYCPFIYHQSLSNFQFKDLFQLCRNEQISFDLEKKIGITFILFDQLQFGVIGILSIGEDRKATIKYMTDSLNFLVSQAGPPKLNYVDSGEGYRHDITSFMDILNKVRFLNKTIDSQNIF